MYLYCWFVSLEVCFVICLRDYCRRGVFYLYRRSDASTFWVFSFVLITNAASVVQIYFVFSSRLMLGNGLAWDFLGSLIFEFFHVLLFVHHFKLNQIVTLCYCWYALAYRILSMLCCFSDLLHSLSTLQAMANFMSQVVGRAVSFDASQIVLTAGATPAVEILCFCLADQGNAFLVPTPYYPG